MSDIRIKMAKDLRDMSDMAGDLHWMAAKAVEDLIKKDARIEAHEAQIKILQSDANSWQSGYDEGRRMGAKHAAPVSEAKAQGVVMPERQDDQYGDQDAIGWNACLDEVARLNAAPVQQVSVPDGWKLVPIEPTPEMIDVAAESDLDPFDNIDDELCAIYAAMLAAAPAAPAADGWIPVGERLPEPNTKVLVHGPKCKHFFALRKNRQRNFWEFLDGNACNEKITHWMPLPAAPSAHRTQGVV